MADLAPSAVSLYPASFREAEYYNSQKGVFTRRIKLTNITQGGSTNKLTAAALGFKKLVSCSPYYQTSGTPTVFPATVDPVNNIILLAAPGTGAIADVSASTGYITVMGT
jgi:hypothetical protein